MTSDAITCANSVAAYWVSRSVRSSEMYSLDRPTRLSPTGCSLSGVRIQLLLLFSACFLYYYKVNYMLIFQLCQDRLTRNSIYHRKKFQNTKRFRFHPVIHNALKSPARYPQIIAGTCESVYHKSFYMADNASEDRSMSFYRRCSCSE